MKFVKDSRALRSLEEFAGIDPKYISGLRLQEQPKHYSAEYIKDYVDSKLERLNIDGDIKV
jgi:aryl-alcohol dehydrogenase-like predicted oxidoreductase